MDTANIVFDKTLINKYDKAGPRYTSYPTAPQFSRAFSERDYRTHAAESNVKNASAGLSLYIHIPFCDNICYYCACNKIITKDPSRTTEYLKQLHREIALQSQIFKGRQVEQMHWGGGTPTFIGIQAITALIYRLRRNFSFVDDAQAEYAIELDPRRVDKEAISQLRDLGFNRVSLGVQDFDPDVQQAINRVQSVELVRGVVTEARENAFHSISMDLIYGLPHQTVSRFKKTLDEVIDILPDRLSLFNYAHLPEQFKPQRRINEQDLPTAEEKLDILQTSIERLTGAGYIYIGMDHFALPDDELAIAQQQGRLTRNFQGYSTHANTDIVAMGVSAIGAVGDSYSQNAHDVETYVDMMQQGHLPIVRGLSLSDEDRMRRYIIQSLMCHFELDFSELWTRFGVQFNHHFAGILQQLQAMHQDGLLKVNGQVMCILPPGRMLIRAICMVFDEYLNQSGRSYSKVI